MTNDPATLSSPAHDPPAPFFSNGLSGDLYGNDHDRSTIVFLHGLTFTRHIWGPTLDELRKLDPSRRVLVLDLPGHGDSEPMMTYDMVNVTDRLHDVIGQSTLGSPVIVGHSVAAIIATVYAARFPTQEVINVDQPLLTRPFAEMLHTLADQLRSPAFASIWPMIARSFHTEVLPQSGQDLVNATSHPRQEIVLGYWQEVMEQSPADLAVYIDSTMAAMRQREVPYLVIAGREPEPDYVAWLQQTLPQARIVVLPDSGHFPHVRHPRRFAQVLLGLD